MYPFTHLLTYYVHIFYPPISYLPTYVLLIPNLPTNILFILIFIQYLHLYYLNSQRPLVSYPIFLLKFWFTIKQNLWLQNIYAWYPHFLIIYMGTLFFEFGFITFHLNDALTKEIMLFTTTSHATKCN